MRLTKFKITSILLRMFWYRYDGANVDYEGCLCADDAQFRPQGANCVYDLTASDLFFDLTDGTRRFKTKPCGS